MNIAPPASDRLPAAPLVVTNITCPQGLQLGHMPDGTHSRIPHALGALRDIVQSIVGEVRCAIAVRSCGD